MAWERAPGSLKSCLVAAEDIQAEVLTPGGCTGSPQRQLGQGLRALLEVRLTPQRDTRWPNGSQSLWWMPNFLLSFTSSSVKWFSRTSQRWGSAQAEPGYEDPKGLGSGSSRPEQCPRCPGFYLTHLGTASAHPGRGHSHRTGLVSSRGQLSGEAAHILQSHSAMVEMDVQRAVRVGGLQMQLPRVSCWPPPRWNNSD